VSEIVASLGVALGPEQPLRAGPPAPALAQPWWRRTAEHRTGPR